MSAARKKTRATTEPTTRRGFTAEERAQAVRNYHARGNRTVKEIATEAGVSLQMLHFWVHRAAEGTLDDMGRKRSPGSTLVPSPPPESILVEARVTTPSSSALTGSEREELALLRIEVRRLRRALVAYADLDRGG